MHNNETEESETTYQEVKEASPQVTNDGPKGQDENHRYVEGDILSFVRVRFPGHAKSYPFLVGKRKLMYGQKVVAMSDRGMAVGYINSFIYKLPFDPSMLPLKSINKIANEEDIAGEKETYKRQKEVETLCQNLIEKHNLDMNLTHVEFTQFGKKAVFYFVAPARVDFRGLVKDLVSELKLRIELRQISVRDRSASVGSVGPCGRELCCSSFLSRYGNVSVKMAKNQNLTLNYSKLNGVCGQLKCCLQYEDEVYGQKRKKLPKEGDLILTRSGDIGEVRRLHLLTEQFDILTTEGRIRRYTVDEYKSLAPENAKMPRQFDHISDETSTVIGLNEYQAKKTESFEKEITRLQNKAKKSAHDIFTELTGIVSEVKTEEIIPEEKTDISSEIKVATQENDEMNATNLETKEQESSENKKNARPRNRNRRYNNNYRGKRNRPKKDGE